MSFEDDLRLALRREEAPADFAARVMARTGERPAVVVMPQRRPVLRQWTAMAAGVALMVLVPAAIERHQENEREMREGAMAEKQVVRALKLTSRKLRMTQSMLREMSER